MSKKKWIATSSGSLIWVSKIRHLLQDSLHHLEKCPNKKGLFWYAKYYILHPHDKRKWACFITLLPLFMHCKVPFLATVFTSQLSSFHFKIYIFPINLQSTNKISISQLIFLHLILKPQRLLTSHIVVTSDINNRMVQNFGILDWNLVFLKNPSQILWTNCFFFFPISCMKWFLSPIKNLYKELVTVYDGLLTKWKSMWREFLNILWMESSTMFLLVHHLYTTYVYSFTNLTK